MTMITPSYLGETIEYSSLHACRSTLEDPTTLDNLAGVCDDQAAYAKAELLYQRSLAIRKRLVGERNTGYAMTLCNLGSLYQNMGAYAKAEPLYRKSLAIQKETVGASHPAYAHSVNNLASLEAALGAYDRAEALFRHALEVRERALGKRHPDYGNSLNNLAYVLDVRGKHAEAESMFLRSLDLSKDLYGEVHPNVALAMGNLASFYQKMGRFKAADSLYRQALEIRRRTLGTNHPDFAGALINLGKLNEEIGKGSEAEPLYRQALDILRRVVGPEHPDTARCLLALGHLLTTLGHYAEAEALLKEAVAIRKTVFGEHHDEYARALEALAHFYLQTNNEQKAEPLLRKALSNVERIMGKDHNDTAGVLSSLAAVYDQMGDYARAEPLLLRAVMIRKRALGEEHPDYALLLNNLAKVYNEMGDPKRAEPLYRRALELKEKTLDHAHPSYKTALNNLGAVYKTMGDFARSEKYHRQALEASKALFGKEHSDYALNLHNVAVSLYYQGDFEKAEPLLLEAMAIRERTFGKDQPVDASDLVLLAEIDRARGDVAHAEAVALRAVRLARARVERTAAVQSERQQRASAESLWFVLNECLMVTHADKGDAAKVYAEVLAWKGQVATRQQWARLKRASDVGGDRGEFDKLVQAARRLSAVSQLAPDPDDRGQRRRELESLSAEIERIERSLSEMSARSGEGLKVSARTPADLRAALPPGCALVDLFTYAYVRSPDGSGKRLPSEYRLVAFVTRPDRRRVDRVELGRLADIQAAINAWRQGFGREVGGASPGLTLRRQIWEPLEGLLLGTSIVLISPDGDLGRFPWAALPGARPGTYLIEDRALALVPIPQLLPELLKTRDDEKARTPPSLLALGAVDFDAAPGASASTSRHAAARTERGGTPRRWSSLPGTRDEISTIVGSFRKQYPDAGVTALEAEAPTEETVRAQVPRHRFVHFATHGYFAPPELRAALATASQSDGVEAGGLFTQKDVAGFHPGLLSGLVLAGANRPIDPDRDDGILTALEVAELDLGHVELATLSACETGLGQVAGSEGLLGLQRAFQVAGARSVVSGLWKVPDRATQVLMTRFYENLWQRRLSKLEALREAQLWMLREGSKQPDLARGLEGVDDGPGADDGRRLPPYYWAAFVLSGDWR